MKLQPYPEYKDSGVPWLGEIPVHWDCLPHRAIFSEVKDQGHIDEHLLSVTITKGIIPQSQLLANSSKKDSSNLDRSKYKLVCPNDIAYNKMRAWQGAIGISKYRGIVSPAYVVVRLRQSDNPNYFHYLLRTPSFAKEAERWSYGITPDMWSLRPEHFKLIYSCLPNNDEQAQIARFLDWKTAHINKFIRNKQRLINLLKEQKQNIINQAVTRGLDPGIKLKPSGVEWIGDIPEHWGIRKLKHIAAMKSGDNLTSVQIAESGNYPVYGGNGLRGYYHDYNKDGKYLLVGRQGALCGNVHRVEGKFWATEHAIATKVRPGISADWYHYMLTVMNLNQYSESAAQPGISVEKIQNLRTALPTLEEQQAIVSHIERETVTINYTISRAQREIDLMREYRTRLISDVVTGKIDVRGIEVPEVNDEELLVLNEDTADTGNMIEDNAEIEIEE